MKNPDLVVAIDLGTSSCKVLAFDQCGKRVAFARSPYRSVIDDTGRVEQDPETWWGAIKSAILSSAIPQLSPRIAAVAVTSLRAAVIPVDSKGAPLCPAILAPDQRSKKEVRDLMKNLGEDFLYKKTGLRTNSYFPLPRILWLKNQYPQVYARTNKFLAAQDYVISKLCGRVVTDHSHASRTLCFNVSTRTWDGEILEKVGVPKNLLPELVEPGSAVGLVSKGASEELQIPTVPVVAAGGDQMCGSLGIGAVNEKCISVNHGTGSFLEYPVTQPTFDEQKRYLCSVHVIPANWVIECPMLVTGRLVEETIQLYWGRDADSAAVLEEVFSKPEVLSPDNAPVFLPYQAISTAPHWREGLTGVLWGLRSFHDRRDIVRALLEGILFDLKRCIESLPATPEEIIVGGRLSSFGEFNQMQADILGLPIYATTETETTALGAAILAAGAMGFSRSVVEAGKNMVHKAEYSHRLPIPGNQARYAELMEKQGKILNLALAESER